MPNIMSEVQLQRKELERLLQTAKDKDRQELLKSAIASLDDVSAAANESFSAIHPALRSSLHDDMISNTSLETAPSSSSASQLMNKIRPLSAQPRRRLSFGNLAAIPENRSLLASNVERHQQVRQNRLSQGMFMNGGVGGNGRGIGGSGADSSSSGNVLMRRSSLLDTTSSALRMSRSGDMNEEMIIGATDVRYIVGSSHDPRRPPINLFCSNANNGSGNNASSFNAGGYNLRDSAIDENSDALHYVARAVANRLSGSGSGTNINATAASISRVSQWVSTGLMPQFLSMTFHERWLILGISIRCNAVDALEVVITNDELGEYYEGDGIDADSPAEFAGHGGHGRHQYGVSTLVVNGVKRPSGDSSSSGSSSGSVFVCDLESVCQSHLDRAPQMVVKKRVSSNRDSHGADVEEDKKGTDVAATTIYGIVGTKLQIKFLRATDSFVRVSEIEINTQSY